MDAEPAPTVEGHMSAEWPSVDYERWQPTCDTLHAHTQLLGKFAVALAPPEPELQHAALRVTARGWGTLPLPAPDASGAFTLTLDLHEHQVVLEHSDGRVQRVPLTPNRNVGEVTRDVIDAARTLAGPMELNLTPQEVPWSARLDQDVEHATYDADQVASYFSAATRAALVLAAYRAPFRGRSTPVNTWWGSFDLAVSLFSGRPADPPSTDFIMRNAMDAQEVAVGWWPGDPRYGKAAFYAYAHPAPDTFPKADLSRFGARWDPELGEYVLDWEDLRSTADPHGVAVEFLRTVFRHACEVCGWDPALAASAEGHPPPIT
jgi:hypothetical protein